MLSNRYISKIKDFVPLLTTDSHKGSNGRIGVVGGSLEYTGAPYFAAISALYVGADLVHVFCSQGAAPVIKSYSPELIVHPLLDVSNPIEKIVPWIDVLQALVIGPGLGREEGVIETVKTLISYVKNSKPIPLIIDADGLFVVTMSPGILTGFKSPVILTPNRVEFVRLCKALGSPNATAAKLASDLKVIVLQKGQTDYIANGFLSEDVRIVTCDEAGSPRRCGGQGDFLSGAIATFAAWQNMRYFDDPLGFGLSAYAAATLTRRCSKYAYTKYKRTMTTSNLIEFMREGFSIFEEGGN